MFYIKKYLPLIFLLLSFVLLFKSFFLINFPDFLVHFYSPKILLSGGNPYTFSNNPFLPNVYPPITILFFFPFSFFSLFIAEKIWHIVSLTSLIVSVYLMFLIVKKNIFSKLGMIILGLIFISFPVKFTLGMGQINNFILLLFTLSIYYLHKKRIYKSAFILALSISMKFFPVLFPIYFFIKQQWRMCFFILVFFLLLQLVGFILFPDLVGYFYINVFKEFLHGWKTDYYNQSLTGFFGRIISDTSLREIIRLITTLFFVVLSFYAILKTKNKSRFINLQLSLLITLSLIINNFSWQHHFVFTIFPMLITFFYLLEKKEKHKLIILFISYILIAVNIKTPFNYSVLLTSHVLYGTVLLWILDLFIILKDFQKPQ